MSEKVVRDVFEESESSGADRLVLLVLAFLADDAGEGLMPSPVLLGRLAGINQYQTGRSVESLEHAERVRWVGYDPLRYHVVADR